jgi:heme A synthase
MNAVRRLSIAALVVACLHLIFGAIVRISGSGMGCGDNWPKCYGYWFPPFSRPDLVVEVSHRYLASILVIAVTSMALVAFRRRAEPGVGGLTAKVDGAAVACTTVPSCGRNPSVDSLAAFIQITHRTLAVLLVLHLFGVVMMMRKRRAEEAPVVVRAAIIAFGMVILQLVVASSMILLHEATGVGIWLSCFVLAYLARRVAPRSTAHAPVGAPVSLSSNTMRPVAARGAES